MKNCVFVICGNLLGSRFRSHFGISQLMSMRIEFLWKEVEESSRNPNVTTSYFLFTLCS